jgi:predicted permease
MIAKLRRALALMRTRSAKVTADVDAEMEQHIELRARRFIERGMPPDIAWAEARRRFGPNGTRRELIHAAHARERRMHWTDWLDGLAADGRYSLRQIRRSPGFAATATITLALGIGANATMFGVIDRLLLQPPTGVSDPATVVSAAVARTFTGAGQAAVRDTQVALSYPLYQDLVRSGAFERVAAYRSRTLTLGNGLNARLVNGMATTASYFATLGTHPTLGRFYVDAEADEAPGADVVVLSHAFWQRELGGDMQVVGHTIELAGKPFRIIGVAPAGFTGVDRAPVDLWIPFTAGVSSQQLAGWKRTRESFFLYVVARLAKGMSIGTAAQVASAAVHAGYLTDGTLAKEVEQQQPGAALVSALPRDAHGATPEGRVSLLLGAVAVLVFILACANVANLQLARTIRRRQEIAIRLALGVARRRLLRQLALDSVLLAILGGAAAVAIAYVGGEVGRRSLVRFGLGDASLVDGRMLAFTAIISVMAGLATGLVPGLQTTRLELTNWLRSGVREGGGRLSRARLGLLVLQATLTVILLAGTGMFLVSLRRVQNVRLGLEPDQVYRASIVTAGRAYTPAERQSMYQQLLRAATGTPGVASAALATSMVFESSSGREVFLPGRDSVPLTRAGGPYVNTVGPDFFKTLGARIIVGRSFNDDDRAKSAPVVIVNQTTARLWWPGTSAIGKCMKIDADTMPCAEVVGIAENAKRFGIVEDEAVQFYAPLDQLPSEGVPNVLYVRPIRNSATFQRQLQRRLQGAAPALPYVSVELLSDLIAPRMQSWKMGAIMFGIFGALAVVLASVGLYGVLAYDVAQRQQELGVRLALGASRANVAQIVLRRAALVVAMGGAIGLAITLLGGRIVEPMLFETSPYDPLILAAVLIVVAFVSLLATLMPTARATRVDPAFALRGGGTSGAERVPRCDLLVRDGRDCRQAFRSAEVIDGGEPEVGAADVGRLINRLAGKRAIGLVAGERIVAGGQCRFQPPTPFVGRFELNTERKEWTDAELRRRIGRRHERRLLMQRPPRPLDTECAVGRECGACGQHVMHHLERGGVCHQIADVVGIEIVRAVAVVGVKLQVARRERVRRAKPRAQQDVGTCAKPDVVAVRRLQRPLPIAGIGSLLKEKPIARRPSAVRKQIPVRPPQCA